MKRHFVISWHLDLFGILKLHFDYLTVHKLYHSGMLRMNECWVVVNFESQVANWTVHSDQHMGGSLGLDIQYLDVRWLHQKPWNTGCCPQRLNRYQTIADGFWDCLRGKLLWALVIYEWVFVCEQGSFWQTSCLHLQHLMQHFSFIYHYCLHSNCFSVKNANGIYI